MMGVRMVDWLDETEQKRAERSEYDFEKMHQLAMRRKIDHDCAQEFWRMLPWVLAIVVMAIAAMIASAWVV